MSGEKTVIRPNPGAALGRKVPSKPDGASGAKVPPGPTPGAAPRPNSERTVIGGSMPGFEQAPPAPAAPRVAPAGQPARQGTSQDDWLKGNDGSRTFFPEKKPQPVAAPGKRIPLDVALASRVEADTSIGNPLLAAAQPLLILLGRLRLMIVDMQAVPLMEHVAGEIETFERKASEAGVDGHDVQVAKYALCGTADDIVQNLPGTDRHVWLQYSMLARFFQVRTSGVGFFEELNKVLANPAARYDLLELMHACLSLGFEGQYRSAAGGDAQLANIRRDVYQALRRVRARSDDDIAPRWRGVALGLRRSVAWIPMWAIVAAAIAFLIGGYMLFRHLLATDGQALADDLLALHSSQQITIERPEHTTFTGTDFGDTGQLERIRTALADDIAAGGVEVESVGENIVVRMNNLVLFDSGRADTKKEFGPVAARVAAALNSEPGPINIIGHTDSVRLSGTGRFKNNQELSLARATSVRKALEGSITDATRFVVEGRGPAEPIGDNKTRDGRAKNRRVDLMIPREETLR